MTNSYENQINILEQCSPQWGSLWFHFDYSALGWQMALECHSGKWNWQAQHAPNTSYQVALENL